MAFKAQSSRDCVRGLESSPVLNVCLDTNKFLLNHDTWDVVPTGLDPKHLGTDGVLLPLNPESKCHVNQIFAFQLS